jgi:hypothetical protein
VFDVDPVDLMCRELLRERTPALVAEACAWAVGLSDAPHVERHGSRLVSSGWTLGSRAAADLPLGDDALGRLDLADARPGSFQDALNALTPTGRVWADLLDEQVLTPFVLETCVQAADRVRKTQPDAWADLVDELGEDAHDLPELVRTAEWDVPIRIEAEQLLLAALAAAPLVEVEAEGLPLSLVRAAEATTRAAAPQLAPDPAAFDEDDLAGALFLAEAALRVAGLPLPVPVTEADALLDVLAAEPLEPEELLAVLPLLPVHADTIEAIARTVREG